MDDGAPKQGWVHAVWPSVLGLLVVLACITPLRQQWTAGAWPEARAADAKPLFLAARAVRLGADPLDATVLQTIGQQAGMREGGGAGAVRHADPRRGADKGGAYRSMYPVTAAVLLQSLRPEQWPRFVAQFRGLGFVLLLAGALAAGAAGAGRRSTALLGAGLGLTSVLAVAPPVSEALGVAQANVHVAGITGLALGALGAGWMAGFAVLVGVGAGVKLLPVGLLAPALGGRYWRAGGLALAVVLTLLGLSASAAPLATTLSDIVESIRYQGAVAPKWVLRDAPRPAFVLFHLRQGALGSVTALLCVALLAPHRSRMRLPDRAWWRGLLASAAPRADVVAAGALVAAWMAVLGAGSQRIYAVLQVPAWAWVLGAVAAPRLSWAARGAAVVLAGLVLLPAWIDARGIPGWDGRAVVLLGAWIAWGAVALRAVVHGWPAWGRGRRLVVLLGLCWLAGVGAWWSGMVPGG